MSHLVKERLHELVAGLHLTAVGVAFVEAPRVGHRAHAAAVRWLVVQHRLQRQLRAHSKGIDQGFLGCKPQTVNPKP